MPAQDAELLRLVLVTLRRWIEGGPDADLLAFEVEALTRAIAANLTATHGAEVGREFIALVDAVEWVRIARASTLALGES
jgi:hypothetical protein